MGTTPWHVLLLLTTPWRIRASTIGNIDVPLCAGNTRTPPPKLHPTSNSAAHLHQQGQPNDLSNAQHVAGLGGAHFPQRHAPAVEGSTPKPRDG